MKFKNLTLALFVWLAAIANLMAQTPALVVSGNQQDEIFIKSANDMFFVGGDAMLKNNALIDNSGTISLTGNWINVGSTDVFVPGRPGQVLLSGKEQHLTGAKSTTFNNLRLLNNRVKYLDIDGFVDDTIDLRDCELRIGSAKLTQMSGDSGAIQLSSGFVSADWTTGGQLIRVANTTKGYLFPVGDSTKGNVFRYRPVVIFPQNNGAPTDYAVAFVNSDANHRSFDRAIHDTVVCDVNPNFYHYVNRVSGASPASLRFYYDPVSDPIQDTLMQWTEQPSNNQFEWKTSAAQSVNRSQAQVLTSMIGTGFMQQDTLNNFNKPVFAFGADKQKAAFGFTPLNPAVLQTVNFQATGPQGRRVFTWDFGDGTQGVGYNASHDYTIEGVYTVTLTVTAPNSPVCEAITKQLVDVGNYNDLVIPTAFSPNGDRVNDNFFIQNSRYVQFSMQVYNRWGLQVKSISNSGNNIVWDGSDLNGKICEEGVYVFTLSATDNTGIVRKINGSITILR